VITHSRLCRFEDDLELELGLFLFFLGAEMSTKSSKASVSSPSDKLSDIVSENAGVDEGEKRQG
jgi:hypothetical protein